MCTLINLLITSRIERRRERPTWPSGLDILDDWIGANEVQRRVEADYSTEEANSNHEISERTRASGKSLFLY